MQAYREKTRAIIPCKTTGDPDEVTNVVGSRAYAGVLAELRARMLKMRIDTRDPWLAGQTDPYAHLKQG